MPMSRAHVFVERDDMILVLQQAGSSRWWECPGGDVESSEEPAATAVREVFEETGLQIDTPGLLREWTYVNRHGTSVVAFAFAARSAAGDVVLSGEHSDYAWMPVSEYVERYCPVLPDTASGWMREFMVGMRENSRLFELWSVEQARRLP